MEEKGSDGGVFFKFDEASDGGERSPPGRRRRWRAVASGLANQGFACSGRPPGGRAAGRRPRLARKLPTDPGVRRSFAFAPAKRRLGDRASESPLIPGETSYAVRDRFTEPSRDSIRVVIRRLIRSEVPGGSLHRAQACVRETRGGARGLSGWGNFRPMAITAGSSSVSCSGSRRQPTSHGPGAAESTAEGSPSTDVPETGRQASSRVEHGTGTRGEFSPSSPRTPLSSGTFPGGVRPAARLFGPQRVTGSDRRRCHLTGMSGSRTPP